MNGRRRTTIALAAAAALILSMTAPALARPGRGKPTPPEIVSVTMTLVNGQGLSTECSDGGALLMEKTGNELFPVGEDQIGLYIDGLAWTRDYPDPTSGTGFAGCHGGDLDGNDVPYGGFGITLDDAGEPTDVLWHFDYYLETEQFGKNRTRMVLMEHFTLIGHIDTFQDGTATGAFDVLYHLEGGGESVGYESITDGAGFPLSFTFDMQPQG